MQITALPSRCEITFVGEGAANVVFKIHTTTSPSPDDDDDDDEAHRKFKDHLLRVPKADTTSYPYPDLQSYWQSSLVPLFPPANLVHQQLLHWTDPSDVISRLNSALSAVDSSRRPDFRGSRIAPVTTGMLVADMNQTNPTDTTFEFKPKWLAQSPSAPLTATRCRTCAREAQKLHNKNTKKSPNKPPPPCPLTLLNPSPTPTLLSHLAGGPLPPSAAHRLAVWLQSNALLPRLRDLQVATDPVGPFAATDMERLQLAMTLRDCSCYVRIPEEEGEVEARLGDLDKKNWEGKLEYWRGMERGLVEGGFYEGEGMGCLLGG
ncbi:inositol pentakisphosphate 2-kinase [Podospora conica]|nr:inositol pentakisphosphate 2-kinase [Schizothecium conicum]